jgi:hypothetical protein
MPTTTSSKGRLVSGVTAVGQITSVAGSSPVTGNSDQSAGVLSDFVPDDVPPDIPCVTGRDVSAGDTVVQVRDEGEAPAVASGIDQA